MTTRLRWTALPLFLIAVLLGGCSGQSPIKAPGTQKREIAELQRRVIELQRKAAVQEVEMARLRSQLAALDAGQVASRRTAAPTREQVEERAAAYQSGQVVEVGHPGEVEESDLDDPRDLHLETIAVPIDNAPRRVVVQDDGGVRAEPPPSAVAAGSDRAQGGQPAPVVSEPISTAARDLYDRGYTLFHQRRFQESEAAFEQFLAAHSSSELGDNAWYWIGEARFARQDYAGALEAFGQAIEGYPEGNKVPDALLKAGQVFERQGDRQSAEESYREIQRRFPETAAAIVASERLTR